MPVPMHDAPRRLLDAAVASGDPPAASACVIASGSVVYESAHGASPDGREVHAESVFDVASITKIATTLAIATLVERGEIELDAPLGRWLPEFGVNGKERVSVREVLGHRSGLPAWAPFFADLGDAIAGARFEEARAAVIARALAAPLERPGQRVYSDLGFIALGALVEAIASEPLDTFVAREIAAPLGLASDLGFGRAAGPSWLAMRHVLPTGRTRPREPAPGQEHLYTVPPQPLADDPGRVDDDNAFAMGGVAGHAGLFATARAIAAFGWAIVRELDGDGPLGIGATLEQFVAIDPAEGSPRGLGFDRPSPQASSAGALMGKGPRGAIGHLGFTGCSLWIDLDRRLSIALLTNRTYPGRQRVAGIRALRPAFHDAFHDALVGR